MCGLPQFGCLGNRRDLGLRSSSVPQFVPREVVYKSRDGVHLIRWASPRHRSVQADAAAAAGSRSVCVELESGHIALLNENRPA